MSDSNSKKPRGLIWVGPPVTDPVEQARSLEQSRKYSKTAAYKIGPDIHHATPDLLAQHIVEIDSAQRQAFLDELLQRLSEDDLRKLGEAIQQRLGRGAA